LNRLFSSFSLTLSGIMLIAIAFFITTALPSQVEQDLSVFFGKLGTVDGATANTYRRIYTDRCLLQSIYVFLTGLLLLLGGIFRGTTR
jgi:hypothetical protein